MNGQIPYFPLQAMAKGGSLFLCPFQRNCHITKGAKAGIRIRALSEYYHDARADMHCLVVNYSGLKEEALEQALDTVAEIM